MSEAAGSVNIVLSVNKANFSAAMTEAQRQLDTFAGKAKGAGHGTVSSMQAASASIRLLENPLGNNIRAIERLISQSKLLSGVMKAAFPVVGAIAIGAAVAKLGGEVVTFVQKMNAMPAAIKQGFDALTLAARTTNDQLDLTNAHLANEIAKLEQKPENNLKTALYESRVEADKLATSLAGDAKSVNELLSQNKIGMLGQLLNKANTNSVSSSVQVYMNDLQALGNRLSIAAGKPGNDAEVANLKKQITDKQNAGLGWPRPSCSLPITLNMPVQMTTSWVAISRQTGTSCWGFRVFLGEQHHQQSEDKNKSLTDQKEKDEIAKAKADAAKQAAREALEARKKAAAEQLEQWESDNSDWKAVEDRSLRDDAAWWKAKLDLLTSSSLNYRAVSKKMNADIIADNREYAELIAKYTTDFMNDGWKRDWLSPEDTAQITAQGKATTEWIVAMRQAVDLQRDNAAAMAESSVQMALATGNMSKLDAAQTMANLHTQQYNEQLDAIKDARETIENNTGLTDMQRRGQLAQVDAQAAAVQGKRDLQVQQDNQATNPAASLASVGFVDAPSDFVLASRDAATQMRDLATGSLSTVNGQIVRAISGQRTEFGNAGAGIFRNVAGMGVAKAEGSLLSGLGFGKSKADGTKANPLYVRIADALTGAASSVASTVGHKTGSFIGSIIDMLPKFADGGPISSNMMSIVGENGPELFMPSNAGHIIPNHQLSGFAGKGDMHIHIDAKGATDPPQTQAAVQRGIMMAAPHIVAASRHAVSESRRRTPATAH